MQSKATTVQAYLDELPDDRRAVVETVLELVRKNLPGGYAEMMTYGMICWGIPLAEYPDTYNGQPLCYAALASQKNHLSLYVTGVFSDPKLDDALRAAHEKAGKKLDMGKSCIRFKRTDELVLDAIAKHIAATPRKKFIARYEESRGLTKAGSKPAKKKTV